MTREQVIKGLESVYRCVSPVTHTCGECPYQDNHVECKRRVLRDAITILKAQEARVLTLEELRQLEWTDHFVWVENNGDADCFDGYGEITISILSNSVEIFQFGNEVEWKPCNNDYCKTWRCWTSKPTDEQREAVKWR